MQSWTPGKTLDNGRFIIEKPIGGGGYGITYRAKDNNSGNLVVIKTLNAKRQAEIDFPQQQVKFVNEALRLARCSHPHIVQVYEVIEEGGLWGMVMEHIDGDDLAVYLEKQGKPLSETEALRYVQQVGQALEYVHGKGFLHRDVKPNNILLRRSTKEAVLIDFGLTREFTVGKTGSMTSANTEGYAPVEQYERRGNFGAYTDVYALAATLYSLLTEEVPIPAQFRKHAQLPPPQKINSKISDRVNHAILKGMEMEPTDRSQTVGEWLAMLSLQNPSLNSSTPLPEKWVVGLGVPFPTRRFEFKYAKIDKSLKITHHPGQGEFFAEDLGNGVVLEMVAIPGGTFLMGSPESEKERSSYESPQHKVTIQPFFMGKFTITQEQYQAVMGKNPAHFPGKKRPVEYVSWDDAVEFCAMLSNKTGKKYQLPSEAQWEYACRAGTTTPFHFGETITTDLVNYDGNYPYGSAPKGKYREQTTDVGSFPANAFGLYDMHGNVWEWCQDEWHKNYDNAPSDGSAWLNENDNQKLLRGGSWYDNPGYCRGAIRNYGYSRDVRDVNFGFRVVLSLA
jgi:formylglycine-generating enzyme required for sulfatase activity/tRNA A-37 threonylcarbamoyl transferase component Bud32